MPQSKVTHIKRIDWNKLDLSDEVNIAAQMIVLDIRTGIEKNKDIDGNTFAKLAPSTIKAKRAKGYPLKPLWAKGMMKEVYVKPLATRRKPQAKIQVPKGRDGVNRIPVGVIHNIGEGLPKREWYGVGKRVLKKLRKEMKMRLNKQLKIGRAR